MARKGSRYQGTAPTGMGARVRALREKAEISQEKLARMVGCTINTIARLERGETEIIYPMVLELAWALGLGPDWSVELMSDREWRVFNKNVNEGLAARELEKMANGEPVADVNKVLVDREEE